MHELGAALREKRRAVFLFQLRDILDGISQRDEPFQVRSTPCRMRVVVHPRRTRMSVVPRQNPLKLVTLRRFVSRITPFPIF